MKKNMKVKNTTDTATKMVQTESKHCKNVVVRPTKVYRENEVRDMLRLGKKSFLVPSKYTGMRVKDGLVKGTDIIAHLERVSNTNGRGRRSFVKIGRHYKSGSVTVVSR